MIKQLRFLHIIPLFELSMEEGEALKLVLISSFIINVFIIIS